MARSWDKNYYGSTEWQRKKEEYADNHEKICCVCGCNDSTIDLHHLNYANFGGEEQESDLVYLCRDCHKRLHDAIDFVKSLVRGCYMNMSREYEASRRAKFMEECNALYPKVLDEYEKDIERRRFHIGILNHYNNKIGETKDLINKMIEKIPVDVFRSFETTLDKFSTREEITNLFQSASLYNKRTCNFYIGDKELLSGKCRIKSNTQATVGMILFCRKYLKLSDNASKKLDDFIEKEIGLPRDYALTHDEFKYSCIHMCGFFLEPEEFLLLRTNTLSNIYDLKAYIESLKKPINKPIPITDMFLLENDGKFYLISEDPKKFDEKDKDEKQIEAYKKIENSVIHFRTLTLNKLIGKRRAF